jgi:hypothetical protein
MAEALTYVVVCTCAGQIEPIAYIDDNRPADGPITVSAVDPEGKQIISAPGYHPEVKNWRAPDGYIAGQWADRTVTEIVWDWEDMRTGWVIRCDHCQSQAQMSHTTLERIADLLAANLDPDRQIPAPESGEPLVLSWTEDGWAQDEADAAVEWHQRYLIQLGVLIRESQSER